jgi:hypothetical protein
MPKGTPHQVRTHRQGAKRATKEYRDEYLKTHPCVDCGEDDIIVLIFDHQRDKLQEVSYFCRLGLLQKMIDEIAKCEVRCFNCHVRRHHRDGYNHKPTPKSDYPVLPGLERFLPRTPSSLGPTDPTLRESNLAL